MNHNQLGRRGEREAWQRSSSVGERNISLFHGAFRTGWPWLEPNTSVLVSPSLPNKGKCTYQAQRRRQLLALSDECLVLGLGLRFPPADSITTETYGATGAVWKWKCKKRLYYLLGVMRAYKREIYSATASVTAGRRGGRLCNETSNEFYLSAAVINRQRDRERVSYLWGRSNTAAHTRRRRRRPLPPPR